MHAHSLSYIHKYLMTFSFVILILSMSDFSKQDIMLYSEALAQKIKKTYFFTRNVGT